VFFDVGHFVKPPEHYLKVLRVFNELEAGKVETIEDEFEKIEKIMKSKDFRLEVVGSYSILEELGQGAFGAVYLAKKGVNEYALKRLSL
jgi:serine/threonine protein kinase